MEHTPTVCGGRDAERAAVRRLRRFGGGAERETRPPGMSVLTPGLRRLLVEFATQAIVATHLQE